MKWPRDNPFPCLMNALIYIGIIDQSINWKSKNFHAGFHIPKIIANFEVFFCIILSSINFPFLKSDKKGDMLCSVSICHFEKTTKWFATNYSPYCHQLLTRKYLYIWYVTKPKHAIIDDQKRGLKAICILNLFFLHSYLEIILVIYVLI